MFTRSSEKKEIDEEKARIVQERKELEEAKKVVVEEIDELVRSKQKFQKEYTRFQEESKKSDSKMADGKGVIGFLEHFELTENWADWQERLEQFFMVNDVSSDKKVAFLITALGKEGYALLKNVCLPSAPSSKKYEELIKLMQEHLSPAPGKIAERHKFMKLGVQSEGESIATFSAKLKKLSSHCNFGNELNDHLLDQFVWGFKNSYYVMKKI